MVPDDGLLSRRRLTRADARSIPARRPSSSSRPQAGIHAHQAGVLRNHRGRPDPIGKIQPVEAERRRYAVADIDDMAA